ncbi:hypothetical protein [Gordonia sp. CPCC 205333]|uniref:hypothetical protein n=1 Tax=Gordonia sp. CPCC 205333 TaxID=3140790 RepID=UPI003AF36A62
MELPHTQKPLLATTSSMVLLAVFCSVAMVFDDRVLLGVNVWAKPLKFAVAFALYSFTLAWLLHQPHRGQRWTRKLAMLFAITAVVDVGFVVVQAARGTFSHFNTAKDPVNSIGQIIFMSGVPGLFIANLAIAGILLRQKIGDRSTTIAMRAGLVISVIGMGLGYLVGWAGTQVVRDARGDLVELGARHTVGGGDGGPGLPVAGWSTIAGDLRIPHFLGLHGMQMLLVAAFVVTSLAPRVVALRDERARALMVRVAGFAYTGLLVIALWQALRGQSVVKPDMFTLLAVGAVVALSIAALIWWWPVTSTDSGLSGIVMHDAVAAGKPDQVAGRAGQSAGRAPHRTQ